MSSAVSEREPQAARLARARAVLHAARSGEMPDPFAGQDTSSAGRWPVPEQIRPLVPGGWPTGAVSVCAGSSSLLVAVVAELSKAGAWVALVGLPKLGLAAAHDAGVDLARTVVIPDPGDQAATVVGTLLDGIDAVVCGPRVALTPALRRRIEVRVRQREGLVLSTEPWPGAAVEMRSNAVRWQGLGAGRGHLTHVSLAVSVRGRRSGQQAPPVYVDFGRPHEAAHGAHRLPSANALPTANTLPSADRRAG